MKRILALLAASVALSAPAPAAEPAAGKAYTLEEALAALKAFDDDKPWAPLWALEREVGKATNDPSARKGLAQKLAAIVGDAQVSASGRLFACKQLVLVASDEELPVLVKLMDDPKTAEMGRIFVAAMPGPAATTALRQALTKLQGPARIGVIGSLGERRDAESVGAIAAWLADGDPALACAAAKALGNIATAQAVDALGKAASADGPVKDAVADALLRAASTLGARDVPASEKIYRSMLTDATPRTPRLAALSGLARLLGPKALPVLLEATASQDAVVRGTALNLLRPMPGEEVTPALVNQLRRLAPPGRAQLLAVLADRGDKAASQDVAVYIGNDDAEVRVAAVAALGVLGDVRHIVPLAKVASSADPAASSAARAALIRLGGNDVPQTLLALCGKEEAPLRAVLVRAAADRKLAGADPVFLAAAKDSDPGVRAAGLDALAAAGGGETYGPLIDLLQSAPGADDAEAVAKAVLAVGNRLEDPAARLAPLQAAYDKAKGPARATLLRMLGRFGGTGPLKTVRSALAEPELKDAAVRALAAWPDASASGDLLAMSKSAPEPNYRMLAFRGYLRLVSQAKGDARTQLAMLEDARAAATTVETRRMVLGTLSEVADVSALKAALDWRAEAEVRPEAVAAVLKIASSLAKTRPGAVREAMAQLQEGGIDEALKPQVQAVLAQAAQAPASAHQALDRDPARSAAARAQLEKKAPQGFTLAAYLDCGPDTDDAARNRPSLKLVDGQAYVFGQVAAGPGGLRMASCVFDGGKVVFELAGLDAKKDYRVGFAWWDVDHDTRKQSLYAVPAKGGKEVRLVEPTALPAGDKGPQEITVALPRDLAAAAPLRLEFRNEGQPNVVVQEIWVWESK